MLPKRIYEPYRLPNNISVIFKNIYSGINQKLNIPFGDEFLTKLIASKDISITAKLLYARMSGFEEFFESPEKTAEQSKSNKQTEKRK